MRFVAELADLAGAIKQVQGIVERRNTIPILSNVLLTVDGGVLHCTVTDLDIEAVAKVPVAFDSVSGTITVPCHMLNDMLRRLPNGAQVSIESTDGVSAALSSGRSKFKLACLPAEDFPKFAKGESSREFSLPSADLRRLIDKTKIAISTEETRFYLNGIYLHGHERFLRAVSTNGHILARCDMDVPQGAESLAGVIVPRKTVLELAKLLADHSSDVAVHVNSAKITFHIGDVTVSSKLIDGTFPDYQRVIPTENENVISAARDELSQAVERAKVVLSHNSAAVKLSVGKDFVLELSCTNSDGFQSNESVDLSSNGSKELIIGFNGDYLTSILAKVTGDTATFAFGDACAPALVTGSDDPKALYVVMPMRV